MVEQRVTHNGREYQTHILCALDSQLFRRAAQIEQLHSTSSESFIPLIPPITHTTFGFAAPVLQTTPAPRFAVFAIPVGIVLPAVGIVLRTKHLLLHN